MLTYESVFAATRRTPWELSNRVLYSLCSEHPWHSDAQEVIAKILLIGRVYAAAIERRRTKEDDDLNDDFYICRVAPAIVSSKIDSWLKIARTATPGTPEGFQAMVDTHRKVTDLFSQISGLDKRSLASKYLHFHVPRLFFIFDSRAVEAMRQFSLIVPRASRGSGDGDNEYRKFAEKCESLGKYCNANYGLALSPRHLDNLLLAAHAGAT